jgi:hypothetical protein
MTSGTSAMGMPLCWARNTRNASLKRASVNTAPMPTTCQYAPLRRFRFSRRIGLVRWALARQG